MKETKECYPAGFGIGLARRFEIQKRVYEGPRGEMKEFAISSPSPYAADEDVVFEFAKVTCYPDGNVRVTWQTPGQMGGDAQATEWIQRHCDALQLAVSIQAEQQAAMRD